MEDFNFKIRIKEAFVLFVSIILLTSTFPIIGGEGEADDYKTILLPENKLYEPGDLVTLEVRFFKKDVLTVPDDINVTLGYEWNPVRYVEVDLNDTRVETGVFRISFILTEEDVENYPGDFPVTVTCSKSESRSENSDSVTTYLRRKGDGTNFEIRISVDKPRFNAGDTVRFTVELLNNSEHVSPDSFMSRTLTVNGKIQGITLEQDGIGRYHYDYTAPEGTESREIQLEVQVRYKDRQYWSQTNQGWAFLRYYQVWFHKKEETRGLEGVLADIGVSDEKGKAIVADMFVKYWYNDGGGNVIKKNVTGVTGEDGLMEIELNLTEIAPGSNIDVLVWANGSGTRATYQQWAHTTFFQLGIQSPGNWGLSVVQHGPWWIQGDTTVEMEYSAYYDGDPLPNHDIYYYFFTSPWSAGFLPPEVEFSELYAVGMSTTDSQGRFTVQLPTPPYTSNIEGWFKAEFNESRSGTFWESSSTYPWVNHWYEVGEDMTVTVDNFGVGKEATVTVRRSGVDGGYGGVSVLPIPTATTPEEVYNILTDPFPEWRLMNQVFLDRDEKFEGNQYTRKLGIPEFFPENMYLMVTAGMGFDQPFGTRGAETPFLYLILLAFFIFSVSGTGIWSLGGGGSGGDPKLKVSSDAPSSINSDEAKKIGAIIFRNPPVEGADATIEVTGSGSVDNDSAESNENGEVFFTLRAYNITNEDSSITLWINATRDGYQDVTYRKEITVIAYIEPQVDVTDPQTVDLADDNSATVVSGIEGEVTINVVNESQPDSNDPDAVGIYINITKTGSGKLHWMNITIDYDQIPNDIEPERLRIFYWDEENQEWKRAENSGVDNTNKKIWANVTHLTIFAPREAQGDITPPTIDHTIVTTARKAQKIEIKASITDDGDGVQKAELYYRKNGNRVYKKLEMTNDGNIYSAEIPGTDVYLEGVEYYIKASDGNNSATVPTNINNPYSITVSEKAKDKDDDDEGNKAAFWVLFILLIILFVALITIDQWSDKLKILESQERSLKSQEEISTESKMRVEKQETSETKTEGSVDAPEEKMENQSKKQE